MATREMVIDRTTKSYRMQPPDSADNPPSRGPYCMIRTEGSDSSVPWYMLMFDEDGRCTSTKTLDDLLVDVKSNQYTDIFLFSHGWNNSLPDALESYRRFICGYVCMDNRSLALTRSFKPLLIGVYWPSAVLVMPWEHGPQIAGGDSLGVSGVQASEIEMLAGKIGNKAAGRLREIASRKEGLLDKDLLEVATLLAPVYVTSVPDLPSEKKVPSPKQLRDAWRKSAAQQADQNSGQGGLIEDDGGGGLIGSGVVQPQIAGFPGFDLFRAAIRSTTVLLMKDRVGQVGAHGVGDLLKNVLATEGDPRVHLLGHSYGCKVILSALCYPSKLPRDRRVNSVLLLQPAISYLAFAPTITDTAKPGGYHTALSRVEQPIMTTFSSEDKPLHDLFHWAVRRADDIGEMQIAGGEGAPNKYAAMGGWGPGGLGTACATWSIHAPGQPYSIRPIPAPNVAISGVSFVLALQSAGTIHGHGDISNPYTYWALYSQVVN